MDWQILKSFFQNNTNTHVGGVVDGLDVFSIGNTLINSPSMNIVYVVKNEDKLIKISQLVSEIYPNLDYIKIPAWDCLPYDNVSPSARITGERINSFIKIGNNKPIQLIIITINA